LLDNPGQILTRFLVFYTLNYVAATSMLRRMRQNGAVCVDEPNDVFVPGLVRLAAMSQCRLESSALLRRL
jgi:hypothetical protein